MEELSKLIFNVSKFKTGYKFHIFVLLVLAASIEGMMSLGKCVGVPVH